MEQSNIMTNIIPAIRGEDSDRIDINYENVEKLYKIFFPNRATDDQLTREAIEALVDVGESGNLKHVVMTLCYDPSWQML